MTYKIILQLIFYIGIVTSTNIYNEQFKMLNKIKSFLQYQSYNAAHFNNYARNIQTNVELYKDIVTHADREKVIQRYQFPPEIMKGFQSAFMSKSGQVVELINFKKPQVNSQGTSTYTRLIGYAQKIDNVIAFVVAKGFTQCGFVQKTQKYQLKKCKKRFLGRKECWYETQSRNRGYNSYELNQLSLALDIHNQVKIKEKITINKQPDIIITCPNRLYSASRKYSICVKPNGFIAIYVYGREDGGFGKTFNVAYGPYSFRVKQNGDIVIQNDRGSIFWSAGTAGIGQFPYTMILTEDKNIVVIDSTNKPIWDRAYKYGHLNCVLIQEYKLLSKNKKYYAEVKNGLIQVFEKSSKKVVSKVGNNSSNGYFVAYLEKDGKLIIENNGNIIYRGNSIGPKDEYRFKVTDDGKLAIVNGSGNAVFTSQ